MEGGRGSEVEEGGGFEVARRGGRGRFSVGGGYDERGPRRSLVGSSGSRSHGSFDRMSQEDGVLLRGSDGLDGEG